MIDMARKQILPAGFCYASDLADSVITKIEIGIDYTAEKAVAEKVSALNNSILEGVNKLDDALLKARELSDALETAKFYRNEVYCAMGELRAAADELETLCPEELWPFPTYADLLFKI
jgi:glutamine synthetase